MWFWWRHAIDATPDIELLTKNLRRYDGDLEDSIKVTPEAVVSLASLDN